MATRLYFHATNCSTGPTAKASGDTDYFTSVPADKNTPKDMTTTKGTTQTSSTGNYNNAGSNRMTMYRIWVSPALAAQTLTGSQAGYYMTAGYKESSGNMNMALRWFVYIWRSGTGKVKDVISNGSGLGVSATEHSTSEVECVLTQTGQATNFSILDGDRFVVEAWFDLPNTKSVAYDATSYYDGTDDTMTDGTATSDCAGYFECPQTLLFPAETKSTTKASQSRLLKNQSTTKASQSRFLKGQSTTKASQSRFLKVGSITKASQSTFSSVATYFQTKASRSCFSGTLKIDRLSTSRFLKTVPTALQSVSRLLSVGSIARASQSRFLKVGAINRASQSDFLKTQSQALSSRSWLGTYTPAKEGGAGAEHPPMDTYYPSRN